MTSTMRLVIVAAAVLLSKEVSALSSRQGLRAHQGMRLARNPMRRVITMLQKMQEKIGEEGKTEEELYEKFMCSCKSSTAALEKSIADSSAKITQLTSDIEEGSALKTQLDSAVAEAKTSRKEAMAAVADAKAMREKEAETFAKESSDATDNVAALGKAIAALEKGMGGAFLQSSAATVLKKISISMDISDVDRDVLASFLSAGNGEDYEPQSGEIVGILKQMKDTATKDLADMKATEEKAISSFESLLGSKKKEIAALTESIESKTQRSAELAVDVVAKKGELADSQDSLAGDQKFLADTSKSCALKTKEYEANKKVRSEELVALADTIKILNDDDALDLFKKTLPSTSLLQIQVSKTSMKTRALSVLKSSKHDFRLNLISLALKGKKVDFGQVITMIDDMIKLLGDEQGNDDQKKKMCKANIEKAEDSLKQINKEASDLATEIEDHEESIKAAKEEIAALVAGVEALNKQVKEATELRQKENAEYKEIIASDRAAKELIGVAKNRLRKFYQPDLYVPPAAAELSDAERITKNFGMGFTQVTLRTHLEAFDQAPYEAKKEAGAGVMAMLDLFVTDLDKEMVEVKTEEKNAQAEYEEFMEESGKKLTNDKKSIATLEGEKADKEEHLLELKQEKKAATSAAYMKLEELKTLHEDCDWLLSNFEVRKEARSGEIESLQSAKAVLSGADYAFLQMRTRHHRVRR
mmetsp:Transcript_29212/g.53865  ORF Transcript_29212/g.53865 Transcript_29212/m.53865 type:complete len:702 (+) Transcript_29212:118-2223(+)